MHCRVRLPRGLPEDPVQRAEAHAGPISPHWYVQGGFLPGHLQTLIGAHALSWDVGDPWGPSHARVRPGRTEPAFRPVLKALTFGLSEHALDATGHSKGPTSGPNLSRPRGPVSWDESHPPGGSGSRRPSWGTPSGAGGGQEDWKEQDMEGGWLGEGRLLRSGCSGRKGRGAGQRARVPRGDPGRGTEGGSPHRLLLGAASPDPDSSSETRSVPDPRSLLQLKMILIKCCDISNEVRPMEVAEPWVDCLLEEYFMQVRATPTLRTSGRPAWPLPGSALEGRRGVPRGTSGAGPRRLPQLLGSPHGRGTPR